MSCARATSDEVLGVRLGLCSEPSRVRHRGLSLDAVCAGLGPRELLRLVGIPVKHRLMQPTIKFARPASERT